MLAIFEFENGSLFFTEASSKKRASLQLTDPPLFTCQTGGRLLADRSRSKLLGKDWPVAGFPQG